MKALKSLAIIAAIGFLALIGQMFLPVSVLADDHHQSNDDHTKQAKHSLFCDCSTPPDTHLVCGTTKANKPYTLNVSATASTANGGFNLIFRDGDVMPFSVPNGSTYSTSHALGGVPNVDTPTVMIVPAGGVHSMMASVLAEEGEAFCINCTGGVTGGGKTGVAGSGDSPMCNFP